MDKDKIIAFLNHNDKDYDKGEVEKWIEKNKDEFKRIKYVWEKAGVHNSEDPDFEKAWMRVNPETRNHTGNNKQKLKILTTRFQRIAAILVLALSFGFIVYQLYAKVLMTKTGWQEVKNLSDNVRKVQLNDGTVLWLNVASDIRYPKEFNAKAREVYLEGEAFFEVEHNRRKPFIVHAGNSVTKVLGTSFNVKSEPSGDVQVTVVTGIVALSGIENKNKRVVLKKGEIGLFSEYNQGVEKQLNRNINFLAWKTGKLSFSKTPLEEVCKILSKHYKTKVYLGSEALKPINLTANYDNKKLGEVLDIMKLTLNIQYQYSDTAVILTLGK